MKKLSKAESVIKLLKEGYSPREVTHRMAVSYNYAWKLKRDLAAAAKDIKTTTLNMSSDLLESLSQGKGKKRVVGTMERKVPGGPATVVRATAEDRVNRVLDERATTYGSFEDVAELAQQLKNAIRMRQHELAVDHLEALDMIASKIARIANGDPDYVDSWTDIAGYATLVADRLQGKIR